MLDKKKLGFCLSTILLFLIGISDHLSLAKAQENKVTISSESKNNRKLKIFSDEAKYDRKNQMAVATGHVKIVQEDATIYTWEARYDEKLKTSFIDNFVRIVNQDKESKRVTNISANKMIAYHQEKKIFMENDVRFNREEERKVAKSTSGAGKREKLEEAIRKERTVINAREAEYWTRSGDALFKGDVVMMQKDKKISGDSVTVKNDQNKNTDTVTIDKNAKMIQIRGEWLVKEGIIENTDEDQEKKRLTKERLEMNADRIVVYQKSSNLIATGNVLITQRVANKNRSASGDKAVFDDSGKTLTLVGNVKIKRENEDWLTAQKAIFHTDSENFEAYGTPEVKKSNDKEEKNRVKSEFTIPDEEKSEPELPINSPEPELNLDEKSPPSIIPGKPVARPRN